MCLPTLKVHTRQAETPETPIVASNGLCKIGFWLPIFWQSEGTIMAGIVGNLQFLK